MKNSVFCVIPSWNAKDLLKPCLDSLLKQSLKPKIIVVDNGSSDGSIELIKENYPDVQLIAKDKNYGFAGGVNFGISVAMDQDAKFIALFNNDAVAESSWIEGLYNTLKSDPNLGIVTSKIMRIDKKHLDSTGDFYSIWGLPFPRGRNEIDTKQYDKKLEIFSASGGASMYRVSMLKEIGLFDEDFFAYFEDVDISFRAQLAGWKVRYNPKAVVYHHVNATSSKLGNFSLFHSVKNFMLLYAKNMPTRLYIKYLPLFTLQFIRWAITSTLRGKLITFIKGTVAAIRLHTSTIKKRKTIQKSRKVSVKYINEMLFHGRPPRPPKMENT